MLVVMMLMVTVMTVSITIPELMCSVLHSFPAGECQTIQLLEFPQEGGSGGLLLT